MIARLAGSRAGALALAAAFAAVAAAASRTPLSVGLIGAIGVVALAAGGWTDAVAPVVAGLALLAGEFAFADLYGHGPAWAGLPAGVTLLAVAELALWNDGQVGRMPARPLDRRRLGVLVLVLAVDLVLAAVALASPASGGAWLSIVGIVLVAALLGAVARLATRAA